MKKWNTIDSDLRPQIGMSFRVDTWPIWDWSKLLPSTWEKAQFYADMGRLNIQIAVNIVVTGRTYQYPFGNNMRYVRVRIEFVGDCEPSTFTNGWLCVD